MVRTFAIIIGILLLTFGILGLLPFFITSSDEAKLLFNIFEVTVLLSLIHVVSGMCSLISVYARRFSRAYFQVFGVLFAVMAAAGFIQETTILGVVSTNLANNFLHLGIATMLIYIGFASQPHTE